MSKKENRPINYLFILKLWQEQDPISDERDPLRIVLKNPKSGNTHTFQSLDELMIFLADLSYPTEA